jgi:hypothetical protein
MAGPLIDSSTGKLLGMLKVEQIPFLDFNVGSLHTLKAVCAWVAAAYGNAVAHRDSQIEDENTRLYSSSYLERQSDYLTQIARRFEFDLTLLAFGVEHERLPEDAARRLPVVLGRVSRDVLRGTDLVFGHQIRGTEFSVLLPGATAEGAMVVADKLVSALRDACGYDVPCRTQVRVLAIAGDGAGGRWPRGEVREEAFAR